MRTMERYGECVKCAECCKKLRITAILSNVISQHGSLDEAAHYYSFRGFKVTGSDIDADTLYLEADIPCDRLTEDDLCSLFDKPEEKPVICHRYPWFRDDVEQCGYKWR